MNVRAELLRVAAEVGHMEIVAAQPTYQDYVKRQKAEGKKPLDKQEWEAKVLGKPAKKEEAKSPVYTPHPSALPGLRELADDLGVSIHVDGKSVHFSGDPALIKELTRDYADELKSPRPVKEVTKKPPGHPYHDVGGN